ncbi:MAG: hypothetical protein DI562_08160, partial [Stenotrophomonas acidaminiphila]
MLEAHEAGGVDHRRIVPGDTDQLHVDHAAPVLVDRIERGVAHARHHRRDTHPAEAPAVHEGIDELAMHPPQRRIIVVDSTRDREWR